MPTTMKKLSGRTPSRIAGNRAERSGPRGRSLTAAPAIRRIGDEWARHWNAEDLDGVAALYAEDAVYLPPHHEAVHGREAIRQYLKAPLSRGVTDLAFEVTYIKQQGPVAWDVGTYLMTIPENEGSKREDHGKYLTVWRRIGERWLIAADAWSSDLLTSV